MTLLYKKTSQRNVHPNNSQLQTTSCSNITSDSCNTVTQISSVTTSEPKTMVCETTPSPTENTTTEKSSEEVHNVVEKINTLDTETQTDDMFLTTRKQSYVFYDNYYILYKNNQVIGLMKNEYDCKSWLNKMIEQYKEDPDYIYEYQWDLTAIKSVNISRKYKWFLISYFSDYESYHYKKVKLMEMC